MNLVAGTLGSLFSRSKPDELQLVTVENRVEPFWLLEASSRTLYDRARTYTIPASGPEVKSVSVMGQDLPTVPQPKTEPAFTLTGIEHCIQELQTRHTFDGITGSKADLLKYVSAGKTEITDINTEMPGIRYILEPREGLSIARNTGIRHSTGEIIAFIADDVTVHSDWLLRLQKGFVDEKVMVVTGLDLRAELETEAQFFFEKYSSFNLGYSPRTFDPQFLEQTKNKGTPVWKIGAGANMAVRRKAFDLVGYFDERLGAGASGCSEDSEFWYRILAGGWNCRYEPTSVVFHYHRRDMSDSLEKTNVPIHARAYCCPAHPVRQPSSPG